MGYDGTMRVRDESLAWEIEDMPAGYRGYVRYDPDAESPRGWHAAETVWHTLSAMVTTSDRYEAPDGPGDERHAAILAAVDRWPHYLHRNADELAERYLRVFHDAAVVRRFDYGSHGEASGVAMLTNATARAEELPDPAAAVDAEIGEYRKYVDGEVYGVTVVRESDGEESSLWGIYDDHPYTYIERDVVGDLISELEATS